MDLKFIGTGGAFEYEYGNSAAWVDFGGKQILIDAGHSVYPALRAKNLADKIDYLLITHLHDDHVGSLSTTILHHKYLLPQPRKAQILYPTAAFGDLLYQFLKHSLLQPEDYVDFVSMSFVPGINFIDTTHHHKQGMQTFAYYFETDEELIMYSGDLGTPEIVFELLDQKPGKKIRVFHELSFFQTAGVHTYYQQLHKWNDHYEIYGYHADPRMAPDDNQIKMVADYPELLV